MYSTGLAPASLPSSTGGSSLSSTNGLVRVVSSALQPWNVWMVERLWPPSTHLLLARNWKSASPGSALTALIVSNRAVTLTPFMTAGCCSAVWVLMVFSFGWGLARSAVPDPGREWTHDRSGHPRPSERLSPETVLSCQETGGGMGQAQRGPVEALMVAVPETAGSALYGMFDVLAATGNLWQQ